MGYTLEQNTFIIMSYYRNGVLNEDGDWVYSVDASKDEYLMKYPVVIKEEFLKTHIRQLWPDLTTPVASLRKNRRGVPKLVKTNGTKSEKIFVKTLFTVRSTIQHVLENRKREITYASI
ncbi:hypothetical protein Zmor_023495 [Zophobas morio]|uniref:Uncharacterized protein n=1 Tax=Zophobas morio TaxID=2755281 RepID=A0AA38HZD8_9CUCU|nr:hypothetical protein Zmor_023495 [Zophobas morio]